MLMAIAVQKDDVDVVFKSHSLTVGPPTVDVLIGADDFKVFLRPRLLLNPPLIHKFSRCNREPSAKVVRRRRWKGMQKQFLCKEIDGTETVGQISMDAICFCNVNM